MYSISTIQEAIANGHFNQTFATIYADDQAAITHQQARYTEAVSAFSEVFDASENVSLFSAPGRTEVGGNHTDHQQGAVLAAAVNLDVIGVVVPNDTGVIRVQSKGFDMDVIDLADLAVQESEDGHSASLIRGIAARFTQLGHKIGGFDAYTTSNVLKGSGLSSSAAFENLIGTILNHLYNDGSLDAVTIAKISQYAEVHYFGKSCGLMDQTASSVGGFAAIDFKDPEAPVIEKIDYDFAHSGYALCIVDTRGSHADLTPEYDAVSGEMKAMAKFYGKSVLRSVDAKKFYKNIAAARVQVGDRAVLRTIHFFNENQRAQDEATALREGDFDRFKALVKASGDSSFKFLQNIYPTSHPDRQGVSVALAISESVLGDRGVCRVHGGGFAGTIQAFVPVDLVETYRETIESAVGKDTCYVLNIRPAGAVKVSD